MCAGSFCTVGQAARDQISEAIAVSVRHVTHQAMIGQALSPGPSPINGRGENSTCAIALNKHFSIF